MNARAEASVLASRQIARRMGAVFPECYRPPRMVGDTVETCRLIRIGCAYQRPPVDDITADGEQLQTALLDKRTASELARDEEPMELPDLVVCVVGALIVIALVGWIL
jgi:hypothetical protein